MISDLTILSKMYDFDFEIVNFQFSVGDNLRYGEQLCFIAQSRLCSSQVPSSWYYQNTVEKDVKPQTIQPLYGESISQLIRFATLSSPFHNFKSKYYHRT